MGASEHLAAYFDSLIERCNRDPSGRPTHLTRHDQIIYYVISTRCEMDMNGLDSVFDQLLTEDELGILIESLHEVGATGLAASFDQARNRLRMAGFYEDDSKMVSDFDTDASGFLDDIEEDIRNNDSLWNLDEQLAELIPPDAKQF